MIRPYTSTDRDAVVELSLRAWAPVFVWIERSLSPAVHAAFYPDGWRASQEKSVVDTCGDENVHTWVWEEQGRAVAFVAVKRHSDELGEIYMIAVDPDYQRRGIANALTNFAVDWLRESGVSVAMVDTGADPGHAPARAAYEKAGFELMPYARYFKKL
jgi:ribosomal protein S18 acetylase RimI-like enzyme